MQHIALDRVNMLSKRMEWIWTKKSAVLNVKTQETMQDKWKWPDLLLKLINDRRPELEMKSLCDLLFKDELSLFL